MRRRVWSVDEIEGIMRAIHERNGMARAALPEGDRAARQYEEGFNAALVTLAMQEGMMRMMVWVTKSVEMHRPATKRLSTRSGRRHR